MEISERAHVLLALCAIRLDDKSLDWSLLAREAVKPGGVEALRAGRIGETTKSRATQQQLLRRGLVDLNAAEERVDAELARADEIGARLTTVLDPDYPPNLRLIWNLPPFLFVRGHLDPQDLLSVAVVGTRNPSPRGVRLGDRLARRLSESGVTVISGLARGIDTVAHTAALETNGRTVAVLGTGIAARTYPAENADLADRIIASDGALVSQFWPSTSPARWTFPRRNVVTSGLAQGTVVVEASSTSGAKMQARLALEHGKKAFLLRTLVTDQPWAQGYVEKRGAIVVEDVEDVLSRLAEPDRIAEVAEQRQLTLDLA